MPADGRRVVVTGIGAVTPLGLGAGALWSGLLAGRSGITLLTLDAPDGPLALPAGACASFDAAGLLGARTARRLDRATALAVVAASEAWEDAGLHASLDRDATGVAFATGVGGIGSLLDATDTLRERGAGRVSALTIPQMMVNAAAGQIAVTFGLRGPNFCTATACAASNHALGLALQTIRAGEADAMVVGGTESALTPVVLAAFNQMKALSTRFVDLPETASRPFDVARDGFVAAEGAGALVLEEAASAARRGARVYAELAGFGQASDAYHITHPPTDGAGAALAITRALRSAGLEAGDVGHVNAHATSTPVGDVSEANALRKALGEAVGGVAVSSTKSMTGHLLGAAGAVEAVATVLALHDATLPPTINLTEPDPECALDVVGPAPRAAAVEVALSNGFGFGGHNAVVVFRRAAGT